jgi:hypothetical protein
VYGRRIGEETLSFGHEGLLYKRSFIMYDRKTKSLWVHVTGEAVKGPRRGDRLKFLPSVVVNWGEWKKRYPKTTVLEGQHARGFMGAYTLNDRRKQFGLSVGDGKNVRLYRFADLAKQPVLHDTFDDKPIVVVFHDKAGAARAYVRGDRKFSFQEGVLTDDKGRAWDWFTGWALGEGDDATLEPVPATVWLANRWRGHFPKGDVYKSK